MRAQLYEQSTYLVQRLGKDEDEEEKEKEVSSFSSSSFDAANAATGTEIKAAIIVAEMVDNEGLLQQSTRGGATT